jgi:hypothetical protein
LEVNLGHYQFFRSDSVYCSSSGFAYLFNADVLQRTIPSVRRSYMLRHPIVYRYRNINLFSIGFASRLHLRTRLTLILISIERGNLSLTANGVSHPILSLLMPTFSFPAAPPHPHRYASAQLNAPLPLLTESIASVIYLMPDYFPRRNARLVSCYALFK